MSSCPAAPLRIDAFVDTLLCPSIVRAGAGRVKHYEASLRGDLLLPESPISKIELDVLTQKMHSLQLVTVRAVAPSFQNNFLIKYNGVAPAANGQRPLHFSCDCHEFWGNGDVCPCVLVVADHLDVISFETLLGKLEPRRAVGRPRRIFDGNCRKPDTAPSRPPAKHSADWFLAQIRKHPALYYHKWQVARAFGEEARVFIGRIDTFRVLPAARGRAQGTKLWQITYPEHPGDSEELNEEELAKALALADELGARGAYQSAAAEAAAATEAAAAAATEAE